MTKVIARHNIWIFALLAKVVTTGRSASKLIRERQYWDAKLLIRSLYDAVVDIHYILHAPSSRRQMMDLLEIEMAVDDYEQLRFFARRENKKIADLPQDQTIRRIVGDYRTAQRQPAFNASRNDWPKRWRSITNGEKRKCIRESLAKSWLDEFDYLVSYLGDAAAHSRFAVLKTYVREDANGIVRFVTRPKLPHFLQPTILRLEVFVCLLGASAVIIDHFHLNELLAERAQRLRSRWLKAIKRSGGTIRQPQRK